jgi:hypothetical protein
MKRRKQTDFWSGCTGANLGYSMVNVGRRMGGEKLFVTFFSATTYHSLFDIWHTAFPHAPILWDFISGMSLIHFLFIDLVKFSTLMVNGRKFSEQFSQQLLITAS